MKSTKITAENVFAATCTSCLHIVLAFRARACRPTSSGLRQCFRAPKVLWKTETKALASASESCVSKYHNFSNRSPRSVTDSNQRVGRHSNCSCAHMHLNCNYVGHHGNCNRLRINLNCDCFASLVHSSWLARESMTV